MNKLKQRAPFKDRSRVHNATMPFDFVILPTFLWFINNKILQLLNLKLST
ncbi:hypothetical protein GPAL_3575 [Glaciecola pallidula DSM 14239 = ACAM 615]|jgi:hypothetical protein|uniref:Uncharacterized protein n=1 Tax=Brumicola pallidula DSM 14239 = ACAM 615 TaxID=1121922 RepID=K6ZJB4_9ALTE|nr:hypothetical protein GPAL_3575 [Glaciecola pallidula DSM 14239 = ACAM 615]